MGGIKFLENLFLPNNNSLVEQNILFISSPPTRSKTKDFVFGRLHFELAASDRPAQNEALSIHRICRERQRKPDIR